MLPFWERVKHMMEAQRLTHANVEDAIGVSNSQLSSWILNDRLPRADHALGIAKYLSTSLEWLITGNEPRAIQPEALRVLKNKQLMDFATRIEKANMKQFHAIDTILEAFEL